MNETVAAAALVAGNSLSVPLRGGDESTTWLGSEEHTLNRKLPKVLQSAVTFIKFIECSNTPRLIGLRLLDSLQTRKPYTITKQRERWSEEEHLK